MRERYYAAIDLKSFYASVECVERGLNPLNTNLVVADSTRTEKTICLAVSPALKSFGIPGRPRLFEVISKVGEINALRRKSAGGAPPVGESYYLDELRENSRLAVGYITAPPRMALYIEYSRKIYEIYLRFVSPDDIFAYSVDEVFIDITGYLRINKTTPCAFVTGMINEVYRETGITATAGLGTNLYLAKVAMDIMAKKANPDKNGVRIAELNEKSYREKLWGHEPISDFWRVGRGTVERLRRYGLYTMGDIAEFSLSSEDLLYDMFGVNAELLIDHAWGYEPVLMSDIKAYKPDKRSLSSGQVLSCGYGFEKTKIIISEMAEALSLDLVKHRLVCEKAVLDIGYDRENLTGGTAYSGKITLDRYNRAVPQSAHGTVSFNGFTSSTKVMINSLLSLFERISDKKLSVRRINISLDNVIDEERAKNAGGSVQLDIFSELSKEEGNENPDREKNMQKAIVDIKERYGKNSIVRGISYEEGATAIERNRQIGGHKA